MFHASLGFENSVGAEFVGLPIHKTAGEMRWAQRFGYGRVGALLYGAPTPPGFWAFLIFGAQFVGLAVTIIFFYGDYTMNQTLLFRHIDRHCNETRPLHAFLNDQRLVCLAPQTFKFFSDLNIALLSGHTKPKTSAAGTGNIPILSPDKVDKGLVTLTNHSTIRYPSVFLRLIIKTSKPASVSMVRWLTQEILPNIVSSKIPYTAVTDDTELQNMIGRHKHGKKGQMLIDLAAIRVSSDEASGKRMQGNPIKKGGKDA